MGKLFEPNESRRFPRRQVNHVVLLLPHPAILLHGLEIRHHKALSDLQSTRSGSLRNTQREDIPNREMTEPISRLAFRVCISDGNNPEIAYFAWRAAALPTHQISARRKVGRLVTHLHFYRNLFGRKFSIHHGPTSKGPS